MGREKYLKCKRCNRRLKTEEAQQRGYGSYCFRQYLSDLKRRSITLDDIVKRLNEKSGKEGDADEKK